jgi:hypothetical protein
MLLRKLCSEDDGERAGLLLVKGMTDACYDLSLLPCSRQSGIAWLVREVVSQMDVATALGVR